MKEGQVLAGSWTLGSAPLGVLLSQSYNWEANPTLLGFHHSGAPYISTPKEAVVEYGNTEEKKRLSKVPQEATRERKMNAFSLPNFLSTTVASYGPSGTAIVRAWEVWFVDHLTQRCRQNVAEMGACEAKKEPVK